MTAQIARRAGFFGAIGVSLLIGGCGSPASEALRVTLVGIDSAYCPHERRVEIWRLLAGDWRVAEGDLLAAEVDLGGLDESIRQILAGEISGRVIVKPTADKTDS